nr:unnamed protein product [Digitaria exilis]
MAAALQAVAQGTGWTYSLLWRLCPLQGYAPLGSRCFVFLPHLCVLDRRFGSILCRALVWADGHYNGAIKTRKTTVVMPASGGAAEEEAAAAARSRSRQLRELYDSLAVEDDGSGGGGGNNKDDDAPVMAVVVARRRPGAAALAPEDLTETEWFYLMSASYCFPPGLGLPGEAFARRTHVWLCGANKVDSKVFSRAILARTVACIPVNDNGVLEIGTTDKRAASNIKTYLALSKNSSFSRWNPNETNDLQRVLVSEATPQRMLKSILLISAPSSSHQRHRLDVQLPEPSRDVNVEGADRGRSRRRQPQEGPSTSHVVKERLRREKLNERASILGDTIEYVKQLRRRVQDLESSRARQIDGHQTDTHAPVSKQKRAHSHSTSSAAMAAETRRSNKMRAVEASSSCSTTGNGACSEVQVSIIEGEALLELRCPHRDGLLLRVMQALHRELAMEVTSVQASSAGDVLLVELRAKVKEVHGRRSSINEVKRTIHQILSSY